MEKGAPSAPSAPPPLAFSLIALSTWRCHCLRSLSSRLLPISSSLLWSPDRGRGAGPGALRARCSAALRTLRAPLPRLPQCQERGGGLREGAAPCALSLRWPAARRWGGGWAEGEVLSTVWLRGVKAVFSPA